MSILIFCYRSKDYEASAGKLRDWIANDLGNVKVFDPVTGVERHSYKVDFSSSDLVQRDQSHAKDYERHYNSFCEERVSGENPLTDSRLRALN